MLLFCRVFLSSFWTMRTLTNIALCDGTSMISRKLLWMSIYVNDIPVTIENGDLIDFLANRKMLHWLSFGHVCVGKFRYFFSWFLRIDLTKSVESVRLLIFCSFCFFPHYWADYFQSSEVHIRSHSLILRFPITWPKNWFEVPMAFICFLPSYWENYLSTSCDYRTLDPHQQSACNFSIVGYVT